MAITEYRIVVDFRDKEEGGTSYTSQFSGGTTAAAATTGGGAEAMANPFAALTSGVANAFAGIMIVKEVEKIGRMTFMNEIQRVGRYAGSQQAQDLANAALEMVSMIKSPIETAINYHYQREQREYERRWESIGLDLYNERAGGAAANRSRSEK